MNGQLLKNVLLLGVEVKPHLAQPFKRFWAWHFGADKFTRHVSLMDMFNNLQKEDYIFLAKASYVLLRSKAQRVVSSHS